MADAEAWRSDFPALSDPSVVYLDSAATAQVPHAVIDAITALYVRGMGNVHRGVHRWSRDTTEAYEHAREAIARFLGAPRSEDVVFTRSATEAFNLLAWAVSARVRERPRVVVSELEHHANLLPWQRCCAAAGAELVVLPLGRDGELDLEQLDALVTERTAVVAVCHVSNALGTIVPVHRIAAAAHRVGAWCVVDGVQAAPHLRVDLAELGCDAYVVSGHKLYGPTGIGAVWARSELWRDAEPWQVGGDMVATVTTSDASFREPPYRFEAGTPNVAGAVGFASALAYLERCGREAIAAHESAVLARLVACLEELEGIRIVGRPKARAGVVAFTVEGIHPHDVGTLLDAEGVAVRTGLHCAEPAIRRLGETATVRASVGLYNSRGDVERLGAALSRVQELFR